MVKLVRRNHRTSDTYSQDVTLSNWTDGKGNYIGLYITGTLPMPGQWGSERIYAYLSHIDLLNYVKSLVAEKPPDWIKATLSYWDESKRLSILHDIKQESSKPSVYSDPDLKRLEESVKRLQREALGQRKVPVATVIEIDSDDPLADLFT